MEVFKEFGKRVLGYKKELYLAKKLARVAGGVLLDEWGCTKVSFKPGYREKREIVTSADMASEREIIEGIQSEFPEHSILSEEKGFINKDSPYEWLIDSLDGTTNYVCNNEYYAVSIALAKNKEVVVAVVFAPALKELFHATRGKGAFLDKHRIRVSKASDPHEALISLGAPRQFIHARQQKVFYKIASIAKHLRWYGSVALDLAYVAAGRMHASIRPAMPRPWDIAAGTLLVQEARGVATDFEGRNWNLDCANVLAANPALHDKLLKLVKS